jgi:hypothetical protein
MANVYLIDLEIPRSFSGRKIVMSLGPQGNPTAKESMPGDEAAVCCEDRQIRTNQNVISITAAYRNPGIPSRSHRAV